jgi:hypothetical protein
MSQPVLLEAIDATICTIRNRARLYRNLVIAVCTVPPLSVFLAIISGQWLAFAGLLFLIPLIRAYLFLDTRLVRRWRERIVQMVDRDGLDTATFGKTVSEFRFIPPRALGTMLAMIPGQRP